tara:strand:- start:668 stop:1900 length:1233 start_codon:yes stop_codon:yes gene_type:complete
MKAKITFILISALCLINLKAQEYVGLSMGPSYAYDIYYSLTDGITASPERTNWELAFSTNPYNNNIRINSGNNVKLYEVTSDINEWENITELSSNSMQLRNSNVDWSFGAFVVNTSDGLNYGWGDYNTETNIIEGSRIYIITYGTNTKKMIINSLDSGVYNIIISNLDGSSQEDVSIDVTPFSNKNFIYYSLQSGEIIDREPNSNQWDLLFTKYEEDLNNDIANPLEYEQAYFVTGVLTNGNLIAQYEGSTEDNSNIMDLDTTRNINAIGYDWKEYSGSFVMVSDRSYYISDQNEQSVYKIIFESFSGQSSGNISFNILETEQLMSAQEYGLSSDEINIYPNPSSGIFFLDLKSSSNINITVKNMAGQTIKTQKLNTSNWIDLSDQAQGFYIIHITGTNINKVNKVSIVK